MTNHSMDAGSITLLLRQLPKADNDVLARLYKFFQSQLVAIAAVRLRSANRRFQDEEDVAAAVLFEFLTKYGQPEQPPLRSREDVLRMLAKIIDWRARNVTRHEMRQKRGGGQVVGESLVAGADSSGAQFSLDDVPQSETSVGSQLVYEEEVRALRERILSLLAPDPKLHQVALLWLKGHSPAEMVDELKISRASVYRKLRLVHEALQTGFPELNMAQILASAE